MAERLPHFGDLIGPVEIGSSYGVIHQLCDQFPRLPEFGDINCFKSNKRAECQDGALFLPRRIASQMGTLQRLVATANGNLQRIVSSWTNCPVRVIGVQNMRICDVKDPGLNTNKVVESFQLMSTFSKIKKTLVENLFENKRINGNLYEREVELCCNGKAFGFAKSIVLLSDPEAIRRVESKELGIGQLFREFNLKPRFDLLGVEQYVCGKVDRLYTLMANGVLCVILESLDVHKIADHEYRLISNGSGDEVINNFEKRDSGIEGTFGDIMVGTQTETLFADEYLSPFERVLLSANGNVLRLLSSAVNESIDVNIIDEGSYIGEVLEVPNGMPRHAYKRAVEFTRKGKRVCIANSRLEINDLNIHQQIQSKILDISSLLKSQTATYMPRFELLNYSRTQHGYDTLTREYVLSLPAIKVLIIEAFTILELL